MLFIKHFHVILLSMKQKNVKGFTLAEVMIVVGIIALLAAIAIPNLMRARVSANQAFAQATLKAISTALEFFASVNVNYPTTTTGLLSGTPPYLSKDYFIAPYSGYIFTASNLTSYTYIISAVPVSSSTGTSSYTVQTGGILTAY